jgi:hypothetical protein
MVHYVVAHRETGDGIRWLEVEDDPVGGTSSITNSISRSSGIPDNSSRKTSKNS